MAVEQTQIPNKFCIDDNTSIFRIMRLEQFLSLISEQCLTLIPLSKWDDPNEGYYNRNFLQHMEFLRDNDINKLNGDKKKRVENEWNAFIDKYKEWYYSVSGTCFSLSDKSDALWKIFSPHKTGVQIECKVSELKDSLKPINEYALYLVGMVSYEKLKKWEHKDKSSANLTNGLIKEEAYFHEKEVRALVGLDSNKHNEKIVSKPIKVMVNCDFIKSITLDPRAENWHVNTLKEVCSKFKWIKNISIEKSKLYLSVEER